MAQKAHGDGNCATIKIKELCTCHFVRQLRLKCGAAGRPSVHLSDAGGRITPYRSSQVIGLAAGLALHDLHRNEVDGRVVENINTCGFEQFCLRKVAELHPVIRTPSAGLITEVVQNKFCHSSDDLSVSVVSQWKLRCSGESVFELFDNPAQSWQL